MAGTKTDASGLANSNDMETRQSETSASEEVDHPGATNETGAVPATAHQYSEMLELMKKQVEISQRIFQGMEKASSSPALSQEILDVLRKMDERQENAGQLVSQSKALTLTHNLTNGPSVQMSPKSLYHRVPRRVQQLGRHSYAHICSIYNHRSTVGGEPLTPCSYS